MAMPKQGIEVLRDPSLNKSTAFTEEEKQALGIVGLVPDVTESEEQQLSRVMMQLGHKTTDLDRYVYLTNLLDHNETLFYRTITSDPARFLPIVYDPTIGEACLKFGHIYRQPRGMYLSMARRGKVKEVLKNWPQKDIRFICVTDAGRILGLGDLGANGMGIPIGKLQLYTACAGVPPQYLLPTYLDAGTNNEQYLHDPLYLGMRKARPSKEELYSFVDEFVEAVQDLFPKCCIHFEDWTGVDAAVADQVPPELLKQGLLYPLQSNILETEIQTAARVAKLVFESGLARVKQPADMVGFIREHVYKPEYKSESKQLSIVA